MVRDPRLSHDDAPAARITAKDCRETLRLLSHVRPYYRGFVAAGICLLLSTLAGLGFPFLTGQLIDSAYTGSRAKSAGDVIGGLSGLSTNTITGLLLATLAVLASCGALQTYWFMRVSQCGLASLRRDVYGHLIRLPMEFFGRRRVGELSSRLATDLELIHRILAGAAPSLVGNMVVLAGGLALITLTSARLTLVMLSTVPLSIALAVVLGKRTREVSRETLDRMAARNVIVEEALQGIACVKAFCNEGYETARYHSGLAEESAVVLRGARYQGVFGACITFSLFGSTVPTIWYGARLVEAGMLTFGGLTRFLLYTTYIGGSLGSFTRLYGEWHRALGAAQRVRELLAEPPEDGRRPEEVSPGSQAPVAGDSSSAAEPITVAGSIMFDDVTFSYASRPDMTVLRNLSFQVGAGQRVALVGRSGAGKSTIVALLLRFYDPDSGRVRLDGLDARDYPLRDLRGRMAIVPQEVLLFGGSIAENIAYGRPGATQEEVERAARQAQAHEFITGFPEGYQTRVGDRGLKLSGGQRQRVAIARAILKDPAILILDEATSSLDSASESLVQRALDRLMLGRTSVIIAHRLSTVRRADRILVIDQGRVVEAGTHEQLSESPDGVYRNLCRRQFQLGD